MKGDIASSIDICSTLYIRYIIEIFREKVFKKGDEYEKKKIERDLTKEDCKTLIPFVNWIHKFTIFFFTSLRYLFSDPKKAYCKDLVKHPKFMNILKEIFTYSFVVSKQNASFENFVLEVDEIKKYYDSIVGKLNLELKK
jgi:hypothetical protein